MCDGGFVLVLVESLAACLLWSSRSQVLISWLSCNCADHHGSLPPVAAASCQPLFVVGDVWWCLGACSFALAA